MFWRHWARMLVLSVKTWSHVLKGVHNSSWYYRKSYLNLVEKCGILTKWRFLNTHVWKKSACSAGRKHCCCSCRAFPFGIGVISLNTLINVIHHSKCCPIIGLRVKQEWGLNNFCLSKCTEYNCAGFEEIRQSFLWTVLFQSYFKYLFNAG